MSPTARGFLIGVVTTVAVGAVGALGYVRSGAYPIGADVPHASTTRHLIDTLRDASTQRAAGDVTVPGDLDDATRIAEGAHEYSDECAGCHLAPDIASTGLRSGLYPQPPNLANDGIDNPAEAFWIIKHGIKMSAMPAWGRTHDDRTLWSIVAFLRKLPGLTPAQYHAMANAAPRSRDARHDGH